MKFQKINLYLINNLKKIIYVIKSAMKTSAFESILTPLLSEHINKSMVQLSESMTH